MGQVPPIESTGDPRPAAPAGRAGGYLPAKILFLVTFLVILAADLGLKSWAFEHVAGRPVDLAAADPHDAVPWHPPRTVVPHILSLRLTTNTGAVFGHGKGLRGVFVLVSVVAAGVILRVFWRSPARARLLHLCLAAILAGALGNLYDRIVYRAVRDMLWLFPGVELPMDLAWPGGSRDLYPWLFNIADVALVVGVGLLLLLMHGKPEPAPPQPPG